MREEDKKWEENGKAASAFSRLNLFNLFNMRKEERSRLIKVGVFLVITTLSVTIVVSILSRTRSLFGKKIHVHVYFPRAGGLIVGGAVRLSEYQIGIVDEIRFAYKDPKETCVQQLPNGEPDPDASGNKPMLRLELSLQKEQLNLIKTDTVAVLGSKSLLGDTVVDLVAKGAGNDVQDGDCLSSVRKPSLDEIVKELKGDVKQTLVHANQVLEHADQGLQAVLTKELVQSVHQTAQSLSHLSKQVEQGPSLVHDLLYDDKLRKQVDGMVGEGQQAARQIKQTFAQAQKTLKRGDVLVAEATQAAHAVNQFLGTGQPTGKNAGHMLQEGVGTLQDLRSAIGSARQVLDNVQALTDQAKNPEGTLGKFLSDPTLYDNLTTAAEGATSFFDEMKSNKLARWLARYFVKLQQKKGQKAKEAP